MSTSDNDYKKLITRVKRRRATLKNAAKELKKHFVGLDDIIDRVIKNIEVWYVMPELLNRPMIINLWGLTGVGKTDLVRRLVKLLKFQDRFCEIQLTNKGSAAHPWHNTLASILSSTPNITSGSPAVLLLDEIQRFRTIDEDGSELHDYKFQDIWGLLSDGCLPFEADMDYLLSLLFSYEKKEIQERQQKLMQQKGPTPKDNDTRSSHDSINFKVVDPGHDNRSVKFKEIIHEDIFEDDENEEYFSNYYTLKTFKRVLRLDEPIEEIAMWDNAKKRSVISSRLNDPTFYEQEDYSKVLILISGNLDEAFYIAHETNEVDIDADVFHNNSLKINILDVKGSLRKRFKPEQIARLGNVHVIYPSLSKKTYQIIIDRRIDKIVKNVQDQFGVKLKIDKTIKELIYKNGVFPAQGTRPVFSTIGEILENNLPLFLFRVLLCGKKSATIFYENGKICADIAETVYRTPFVGTLDSIRKLKGSNHDRKLNASVHEAGHAISYASLFKVAPNQINTNPTANYVGGFVGKHQMNESEDFIRRNIVVYMSGIVAEEMIFGALNRSDGSVSDISLATSAAAEMIRADGLVRSNMKIIPEGAHGSEISYTNMDDSNAFIKEFIEKCKLEARDLLNDNLELLISVSDKLFERGQLTPQEFRDICASHKLRIKVIHMGENITPPYQQIYEKFKKGLSNE